MLYDGKGWWIASVVWNVSLKNWDLPPDLEPYFLRNFQGPPIQSPEQGWVKTSVLARNKPVDIQTSLSPVAPGASDATISDNAICASILAKAAPRQKCGPYPKASEL